MDYFTKWVEAETLANIRDVDVKRFVWKNIITRFEVPRVIVSDKRLQFDSKVFRDYCSSLGISNRYSTPSYPQSNRQAEAMNKTTVNGMKKRLKGAKGGWVDEFLNVLWAYLTNPRRSMGETPFSMTYGTEAVIPIEISLLSPKMAYFEQGHNDEGLIGSLDVLEERRDMVSIRLSNYQKRLAQGYNRNVRPQEFVLGDLVLHKAIGSMKDQNVGKLEPN